MGIVRSFLRRLLLQAVVSGTVMAGLQVAVRFGPDLFPAPTPPAPARETVAASPATPATAALPAALASATRFAQDRTGADVKAGRLPVWQERQAATAVIPLQRLASMGAGRGLGDVMLFDRCRPDCESRDPLLAFNRRPMATPSPVPAKAPEALDNLAVSSGPGAAELDGRDGDDAPGKGIVATAARGGLSVARRLVVTAGSVIGW